MIRVISQKPWYHRRYITFEGVCRSRLKWGDAKSESKHFCKELGLHHHVPFEFFNIKSCVIGLENVSVLGGVSGRMTIKTDADKRAIEISIEFNIYTDAYWMKERVLWSPGETQLRQILWRPNDGEVPTSLVATRKKKRSWRKQYVYWLQMGVLQNSSMAMFTNSQSLCVAQLGKSTFLDPLRFKFKVQKTSYDTMNSGV